MSGIIQTLRMLSPTDCEPKVEQPAANAIEIGPIKVEQDISTDYESNEDVDTPSKKPRIEDASKKVDNQCDIYEKIRNGTYTLLPKRRGRSAIWEMFADVEKMDGTLVNGYLCCRKCYKFLKYDGKRTSNLNRHSCFASKADDCLKPISAEDRNAAFEACTQWIIADCRPCTATEGDGFRKLVQHFLRLGAKYGEHISLDDVLPDTTTIARQIKYAAQVKRDELKAELQQIIDNSEASVTMDLWRDTCVKRDFLCATLHYQRNNELRHIVLGVKSMDLIRSSVENILSKLQKIFAEFGLTNLEKIIFVTVSGSSIEKALEKFTRINCSSNLFNNVIESAERSTNQLVKIAEDCRKLVKYLKSDILPENRTINVYSQWHKDFEMFKFVAENWTKIYDLLGFCEYTHRLHDLAIETFQSLAKLGQDFDIISRKMQEIAYPSICFVLPSIKKLKTICEDQQNDHPVVVSFKNNILAHLCTWTSQTNIYHKVAYFLYPPAKKLPENQEECIKEFCINVISKRYIQRLNEVSSNDDLKANMSSPSIDSTNESREEAISDFDFFFADLRNKPVLSREDGIRDEVEKYSREPISFDYNFDVIMWWRQSATTFPNLSKFALSVFSIPASIAAAQSTRCQAANLISTEKGNYSTPKTVDSILFLNSID